MQIQEVSIVVEAKSHNPSILNPDFLKRHGMVDPDLKVSESPICAEPFSRVVFENGVTITAQFDSISFTEEIRSRPPELAEAPRIGLTYVRLLEHTNYYGIQNSFTGVIQTTEEQAVAFVMDKLIQPGAWKCLNDKPGQAMVRFAYPIEGGFLRLAIGAGYTEISPDEKDWRIVFRGNFERPVTEREQKKRLEQSLHLIHLWTADLKTFSMFIKDAFLGKGENQ